jgi:hypothetical protein
MPVETEASVVVANAADRVADDLGVVQHAGRGDLTGQHYQPGGDQGLARHPRVRVHCERRVQHGVGDLIGDLVGVTLGHRF